MSNHPGLVTLTSWISFKLLPGEGIMKTRKSRKFKPVTPNPNGSEIIAF